MDGERSEEGRYCLVAGDAAASSHTAKRLTTRREARFFFLERRGEEGRRLSRIHLALRSVAPGSCCKMKNYMALIRLHYRTSDYMHLTPV